MTLTSRDFAVWMHTVSPQHMHCVRSQLYCRRRPLGATLPSLQPLVMNLSSSMIAWWFLVPGALDLPQHLLRILHPHEAKRQQLTSHSPAFTSSPHAPCTSATELPGQAFTTHAASYAATAAHPAVHRYICQLCYIVSPFKMASPPETVAHIQAQGR